MYFVLALLLIRLRARTLAMMAFVIAGMALGRLDLAAVALDLLASWTAGERAPDEDARSR